MFFLYKLVFGIFCFFVFTYFAIMFALKADISGKLLIEKRIFKLSANKRCKYPPFRLFARKTLHFCAKVEFSIICVLPFLWNYFARESVLYFATFRVIKLNIVFLRSRTLLCTGYRFWSALIYCTVCTYTWTSI
jgi:hypothetical protein